MCELLHYLNRTGYRQQPDEAVGEAIKNWLQMMQTFPPLQPPGPALQGYQWKALFLPDGTRLRMQYRGEHEYAVVEGDRLMYQGRPVSPNQFANAFGGGVRNAWKELAIRMPGEKRWTSAARRRVELKENQELSLPVQRQSMPTASAPVEPSHLPSPSATPAPATDRAVVREHSPHTGWDLPERRQHRFRIEDVAE
jgi:hypothetical protein